MGHGRLQGSPNALPVDAAYIAGLVDGEGTISLARKHAGENRQLIVSVSNTEASILNHLLTRVGAGKITRKRVARSHHTPSLTYVIWNRQALALLQRIGPFLRSYKQLRAELILANYVRLTPRNGKYRLELAHEREAFEQHVLDVRPTSPGPGRWQQGRLGQLSRVRST